MSKQTVDRSGVKTFNYIRQNATSAFQEIVPRATNDNIADLSNILFDSNYKPQLNEFVNALINRIAFTRIETKVYANPLARFKKGSVPLGTDIQEIYENPAVAREYELSNSAMAELLTIAEPDTHVAYYRLNRKDKYKKTIARPILQHAFVTWDKFEGYVGAITNSLYSGNYIDEFIWTKSLVDGAYAQNKAIVEVVANPTDEDTGKALVKKVREMYNLFKFPSNEWNSYSRLRGDGKSITTWTETDRICLMITSRAMANIDVDVLSAAFNMTSADFLGSVIQVDKFENPNIIGVLFDEAWLQIYDNLLQFDEFYNAETMTWQEYLHAWNTFAISPFANAVILATEEPNPATAIALDGDKTIAGIGNTETVTATLTPTDATSTIEYQSGSPAIFTVASDTNTTATVTSVGAGTGILTATTDNGLSATVNVTVTE